MQKLYGFYVTRSNHGKCTNPVWSGQSKEGRDLHKQWIFDNVSNADYDGVTTFQDVESNIVITSEGYYKDNQDRIIRIEKVCSNRDAFGYIQKRFKSGKLKDKTIVHYWLNGQAFNSDSIIVGRYFS